MPTLAEVLAETRRRFAEASLATPDLDARLLVGAAFDVDRAGLILRGQDLAPQTGLDRLQPHVERRLRGEPVHRILGRRAFYDHEFRLSPETLEPRPDTEILVDLSLKALAEVVAAKGQCVFADVGTGTGAIAVSLLAAVPQAEAIAIDLSFGALLTARVNAQEAGVADRFLPVQGDYLAALAAPLDVVVANPPYIEHDEIGRLDPQVRDFDPHLALDGGPDGLDAYRALAGQAPHILMDTGSVLVEIGLAQGRAVKNLFAQSGFSCAMALQDLAGVERALWFRRGGVPMAN
ncbi:peptide chain release factor N(5)-glutamine methyltransferase [Consotaella aegiceratis]|uniref:peptide chain release factor N(5)-glutamine methyltransferase n=1 Tax=Consotaella aegiceratis TaxID=3097961 RepID=UPI002F40AC12